MNKAIVGKLEEIRAIAEEAQKADEFELLEDWVVYLAQKVIRLGNEINRARPTTGYPLRDQSAVSRFDLAMIPERYRPRKIR
jgi:hypothetical protein